MKPTPEAILADAKKTIGEKPHLCYIAYDETLTDEQIVEILDGDDLDLEWIDDKQQDGLGHEIYETLDEADIDVLCATVIDQKHGTTLMDELREWVLEHDQSDPLADALRNTHDKHFRLYLGESTGIDWTADGCDIDTEVGHIAELLGLDMTSEVADCIRTVLVNAGGGTLNVLWRGDVAQVCNALWSGQSMRWTFEGAEFLVTDSVMGAGHCETLPCKISVTVPSLEDRTDNDPRIKLDVGPRAYSDGITGGLSLPTTHPIVELLDKEPAHA